MMPLNILELLRFSGWERGSEVPPTGNDAGRPFLAEVRSSLDTSGHLPWQKPTLKSFISTPRATQTGRLSFKQLICIGI